MRAVFWPGPPQPWKIATAGTRPGVAAGLKSWAASWTVRPRSSTGTRTFCWAQAGTEQAIVRIRTRRASMSLSGVSPLSRQARW